MTQHPVARVPCFPQRGIPRSGRKDPDRGFFFDRARLLGLASGLACVNMALFCREAGRYEIYAVPEPPAGERYALGFLSFVKCEPTRSGATFLGRASARGRFGDRPQALAVAAGALKWAARC
jgi:hypothetical protein